MELAAEPDISNGGKSKWYYVRWTIHLVVLGSYPLLIGILSAFHERGSGETLLPKDSLRLMTVMGLTLLQFAVLLAVAWVFSRATREQMLLKWRDGIAPIWRGLVYSIALRLLVMVVALFVVLLVIIIQGLSALDSLPQPSDVLVDKERLVADPLYFFINLTFVSFVVAGLREEVWRAGVFAGIWALFPKMEQTLWGKSVTVLLAAIVFGLGHLPQGWIGVALTSFLGLALGAIMIFHRSIWEAVLAHGFFDATTFVMLYLIQYVHIPLGKG
jgi:membrane protease YdiL (CAAX protease family)